MDFDYWDRAERPRTSFTIYAMDTDYQQQHQRYTTRGGGSGGGGGILLDDQEELDSIRNLIRSKDDNSDHLEATTIRQNNHGQRSSAGGPERTFTKLIRLSPPSQSRMPSSHSHHPYPPPHPTSSSAAAGGYASSSSSSSPYNIRNCSSPNPMAAHPPIGCPSASSYSSSALQSSSSAIAGNGEAICAVCGDGHAKLHYGVLACYGCKGFFRRTLTGKYRYICRFGNNCIVDKFQRNSCRCCRFQRCLDVGMDPKAVRPDRDLTGKQKVPRIRKRAMDEELINHMMRLQGDDWSRKIPVEAKMLLMQILNIESKVAKGDSSLGADSPLATPIEKSNQIFYGPRDGSGTKKVSLKELFEQKPSSTRRTEMCYEPYRMAKAEELPKIAHRGAIAAVDWVESLAELIESTLLSTSDKISLVKACYAPLTIFNFSARTAQNTQNPNILCLCSYSYVPRKLPSDFNGSNHLSNHLIDRTLNELVSPLRKLGLKEEEVVALKAIIILDPNGKNLSADAQRGIVELRDRVQDMLFQVVKELHPAQNAASRFGNLLLLLPTITTLSGLMCENMQFCQIFGWTDPLLNELFETNEDKSGGEPFPFFGDIGGGGEEGLSSLGANLPISYSPPILCESHCNNPADISLHSNQQQQQYPQASPNSLPRHLASSRLSTSSSMTASSFSSHNSSASPSTKPQMNIEKCEISTQTEEFEQSMLFPSALMAPSYGFDASSRDAFGHQDVADFSAHSPFHSFFEVQSHHDGSSSSCHRPNDDDDVDDINAHHHEQIDFSGASLLFENASSTTTDDDLFGLMQ